MLKLHHIPNTRSDRIVWLLEELELPYELNRLSFSKESLKGEEHRGRHPLGRVPVLEDGEITLFESGAIVEYLLARHKDGGLKPAPGDLGFPAYLQWFHYCEGMAMPPINTFVVQTLILPPERRDEKVRDQAIRLLHKALAPVEEALEGQEHLIGRFSAADVMLGHTAHITEKFGLMPETYENLRAYVERLRSRPAFQKMLAAR